MPTIVDIGRKVITRKIQLGLLVCMLVSALGGCSRSREARMYQDVLKNKSIIAAKNFFERYPESRYTDELVEQLVGWCRQDSSPELNQIVLEILPEGHPGALELEQFISNQRKEPE